MMAGAGYGPMGYALLLLKMRERSIHEIKVKMRQKGFDQAATDEVISKLIDKNFLNDERFAELYVRSQVTLKPQGRYRLRAKLHRFGLAAEIVESSLSGYDRAAELAEARKAAIHWRERKRTLQPAEIRAKLGSFLTGRGFDWETTVAVINEILREAE